MNSFLTALLEDAGRALDVRSLPDRPWVLGCGKAGPNAVLKVIVPPSKEDRGYVLHLARHINTSVIDHETSILQRLQAIAQPGFVATVPKLLHSGRFRDHPYFIVAYTHSRAPFRLYDRLVRYKRIRWVCEWVGALGVNTKGPTLDPESVFQSFNAPIDRLEDAARLDNSTADALRRTLDHVSTHASTVPSVCCHGDLWWGNILWARDLRHSIVIDWGAARWPGLPAVDLCRFALAHIPAAAQFADIVATYCRKLSLDIEVVPFLFDLYGVFVEWELHTASRHQVCDRASMLNRGLPSQRIRARIS